MSNSPPVHLLWPRTGSPLKRIACGTTVNGPSHWTTELRKASCYECARQAEGLTAEQRTDIWENANDRMAAKKRNPWAAQLKAAAQVAK